MENLPFEEMFYFIKSPTKCKISISFLDRADTIGGLNLIYRRIPNFRRDIMCNDCLIRLRLDRECSEQVPILDRQHTAIYETIQPAAVYWVFFTEKLSWHLWAPHRRHQQKLLLKNLDFSCCWKLPLSSDRGNYIYYQERSRSKKTTTNSTTKKITTIDLG